MEQYASLFSSCFAGEAPHSTPTLLADLLVPRQIGESEDIAANTRWQAALFTDALDQIWAKTKVPDSFYSQCDDELAMAIRGLEKACESKDYGQVGVGFLNFFLTMLGVFSSGLLPCCLTPTIELFLLSCLKNGGPRAAAQLVAAFADPDPEIAFAAIFIAGSAFEDPALAEALLAAGVAPALVTAVGHAESFCQVAAMFSACRGARCPDPKILQELRQAGLAPALMRVVRTVVPGDIEPVRGAAVCAVCLLLPSMRGGEKDPAIGFLSNPYRTACAAAVEVIAVAPDFALEAAEYLVSNEGLSAIFEQVVSLNEDPHPPAHLVSSILAALQEGAVKNAIVAHMLGGAQKDDVTCVFRALMRREPGVTPMTRNALLEFGRVFDHLQGCGRWTPETAARVGGSLTRFIEETPYVGCGEDDAPVDAAVLILSKLSARHPKGRYALMFTLIDSVDQCKLVGNLARVMSSDNAPLALRACSLVVDCIRVEKIEAQGKPQGSEKCESLLRAAADAGYIPHVVRLFKLPPSAWALADSHHSGGLDAASLAEDALREGLGELTLFESCSSYAEEAVRHGLLDVIKAGMRSRPPELVLGLISMELLLAWEDEPFSFLRDAGLWPIVLLQLVDRAGRSHSGIYENAITIGARLAYNLTSKSEWANELGELLAGGFLNTLRAAVERVSSAPRTRVPVPTIVGQYIPALETWAESNWKIIAQFLRLGAGAGSGSAKKSKKILKNLVLKHVLEPEEAGALALVAPRARGPRPQSTQLVSTAPSADRRANGRVPMGTAAAAETGTARQGLPGRASAHKSPSPRTSRERGNRDAPVADPSVASSARERQAIEDREQESGSCEEVPFTERQVAPTSATPGHKKKAHACVQCGAVKGVGCKNLLECAACRSVRYCGRECQAKHWRVHKPACRAMQEEPV